MNNVQVVPYLGRMPRDTLTREQIVKAAIDLLDSEGLEGLNMRALGRRLGSAATAVYWHVGSKDNLIALAGDQVWNEVGLPDPTATGWRVAAAQMATDLHAMLTRHPWLVQAFGSYVVFGPGRARHDDHSLALYEAAGFTGAQADRAMATVFTYVLGNALGPAAAASLAGGVLGRVLSPGASQVTPDQASSLTPDDVTAVVDEAHAAHAGLADQLGSFYAHHSELIKTLGGAALMVAAARMQEQLTER